MSNYLEVDSKILEKKLLLQSDSADAEDFEKFLRSPEHFSKENAPWKLVTPIAGFCVKTTDAKKNKIFVNICKLDDIPEPKDITEDELMKLWESEDASDFRIPLSIQDPHDEFDKSGKPTVAYDVAINTKFFDKVKENMVFRSFVMQVVLEGLEDKYDLTLKKEGFVILQNRKCLGDLRPHRIRVQKTPYRPSKRLIEELPTSGKASGSGDDVINRNIKPENPVHIRIFQNHCNQSLTGEFFLPNLVTVKDLTLDVGEDRIVLESRRHSYLKDIFLPVRIKKTSSSARFNLNNRILTVTMAIDSSS